MKKILKKNRSFSVIATAEAIKGLKLVKKLFFLL